MAYEPGDLAIKMDGYKLNIRSVGIIIHNGKVLLHKRKSADYYALLGGHVRIGESSQDTVKREMQEELGKEIEITGYISTIENFFELKDLKYHEMKYKVKNALLFTLQRGKLNFEKKQKGVCENERSISYYIRRFL